MDESYEAEIIRARREAVDELKNMVSCVAAARQSVAVWTDVVQAADNRMAQTEEWQRWNSVRDSLKAARDELGDVETATREAGVRVVERYGPQALPDGLFAEEHHPVRPVADLPELVPWLARMRLFKTLKVDAREFNRFAKELIEARQKSVKCPLAYTALVEHYQMQPDDIVLPVEDWDEVVWPVEQGDEVAVKIRSELTQEALNDSAPDDR